MSAYGSLVNCLVGSGLLVFPSGFQEGGIIASSVAIAVFAAFCAFSVRLLVWCRPFPGARFDDIAHAAFGAPGRVIAATAVLCSQFGFATSYFVFASQNLSDVIKTLTHGHTLPTGRVILMLWCLCALLQLVRRVERLQFVSVLNAVAVCGGVATIFADGMMHHRDDVHAPWDKHAYGPWIKKRFPEFFGIGAFSYCCQAVVGSLEDALRRAAVADMVRARVRKTGGPNSGGTFEAAFEAWCNGSPLRTPSPTKRRGDDLPASSSATSPPPPYAYSMAEDPESNGEALPLLGTSPWPLAVGASIADDLPFGGAEVSARRELIQVADASAITVTILYVAFGAIGYMFYGDKVGEKEITELLSDETLRVGVQLMLTAVVLCSMPIMLMPCCDILCPERVVGRAWPVTRALIVAAPVAAALSIPCFSQVTALSGAIFNSLLSFLLPAACALALEGGQQDGLSPGVRIGCLGMLLFGLAGVATGAEVIIDLVNGKCQS